jgi:hypothetical protein
MNANRFRNARPAPTRGININHNETVLRRGLGINHNETVLRRGIGANHNETVLRIAQVG